MKAQKELTDRWKEKIRLSQMINRLEQCAMGEVELTPTQIKAAQLLLGKLVPDLARVENTGKDGQPQEHNVTFKWQD